MRDMINSLQWVQFNNVYSRTFVFVECIVYYEWYVVQCMTPNINVYHHDNPNTVHNHVQQITYYL